MRLRTIPLAAALALAGCADMDPADYHRTPQRMDPAEVARQGLAGPAPVTLDEVISYSRQGEPAEVIIARLRASGWEYRLGPAEEQRLRQSGVAQSVINYMTSAQRQDEAATRRETLRRQQPPVYGPYPGHPGYPAYPGYPGYPGGLPPRY